MADRFRGGRTGLTLVELMIAGALGIVILATVNVFFTGSLKSFAGVSTRGKTHIEFLALREYLSRDVQHASEFVTSVSLGGQTYQTDLGATAGSMVLRMPAVDANDRTIAGLYDFAVYTVQTSGTVSSLRRQIFVNRDANGTLLTPSTSSTRSAETKTLANDILAPQAGGTTPALFTINQPIAALAREVLLTITIQPTESTYNRRAFPRTFTARFRLRNG